MYKQKIQQNLSPRQRSIHIADWRGYSPTNSSLSLRYPCFEADLPSKYITAEGFLSNHPDESPKTLRIGNLLGKGGYGEVYEVSYLYGEEERLALKIPRPPLKITKSYIANEIQKLEMLKKPGNAHVPQIRDLFFYWKEQKIPCYITHIYTPFEKKYPVFGNHAPMDPVKVFELFYLLAKGIKYTTSHHIVHNDIKPENIMFYKQTPIITDYGTARSYSEINEVEIERLSGRLHGTPVWLPPELISVIEAANKRSYVYYNLGKVCQKTDIWGLGLILMRCLTGNDLFDSAYIKNHSVPEIFYITHYEFTEEKILYRYRQWAHRQLYRLYGNNDQNIEENLDIYKIRKLLGIEDYNESWIEKYQNLPSREKTSSGKFFMSKLLYKKANLVKRSRSDIEIKDFFVSSLFDFFDICTAPLIDRIKPYRLVATLEAVYPGLKFCNNFL